MMTIANPVRCIIDTDPGVDDVLAILLALASPELAIEAIIITHGNTTVKNAFSNLAKTFYVLERHLKANADEVKRWPGLNAELRRNLGLGKIKVFLGYDGPLRGKKVTATYFHGQDGLSDLATNHPEFDLPYDPFERPDASPFFTLQPQGPEPLAEFSKWVVSHTPGTLIYIALGPLTTLEVLHTSVSDPSESPLHSLALILSMGGAVNVPGNTTPVSEFNIYADAAAAKAVLDLSLPHFHLFPLDITSAHTFPFSIYKSLVDLSFMSTAKGQEGQGEGKSPLIHFTSCLLNGLVAAVRRFDEEVEAMSLHDPLVIWAAIDAAKARGAKPDLRSGAEEPVKRRQMFRRKSSNYTNESDSKTSKLEEIAARAAALPVTFEDGSSAVLQEEPISVVASVAGGAIPDPLEGNEAETSLSDEEYWNDDINDGWVTKVVEFDVEPEGTITRGMLVQDLRKSKNLQKKMGSAVRSDFGDQNLDNVTVETTSPSDLDNVKGTKVSIATPGADTLRMVMLNRIWDVKIAII